ncbi:hypothetical protein TNCV_1636531 [Trichonephila clavipes]|nr:hypothetical protein TNCV_1636531 [Trichonephila clavipes]
MDEIKPGKLFLDFAEDAVLMSLQGSPVSDELHEKLECLQIPDHVRAIEEAMNNLYIIFYKELEEIIYTNQNLIFDSGRKCTTFILCRCLKICEQPSYLSLIVAGSFLYAIVFFWLRRKDCIHILRLCEFSLLAIYRRCFKNVLMSKGHYDNLCNFLRELNKSVTPKIEADELEEAMTALKNNGKIVRECIEQCKTANESNFIFTAFEIKFLNKEFQKLYDADLVDEADAKSSLMENVPEESNFSDSQTEESGLRESLDRDDDMPGIKKSVDSSKKKNSKSSLNAKKDKMEHLDDPVKKNTERNSPQQGSSKYFDELEMKTSLDIAKEEKRKSTYNPKKGENKQSEGSKKGKSTKSKSPEQGTSKHFELVKKSSSSLKGKTRKTSIYSKSSSKKTKNLSETFSTSESNGEDSEAKVLLSGIDSSEPDDPEEIQLSKTDNETEETYENIEEILTSEGIDINALVSDTENANCQFCSTRCRTFLNRLDKFNQRE